jgi:hypothetical protein
VAAAHARLTLYDPGQVESVYQRTGRLQNGGVPHCKASCVCLCNFPQNREEPSSSVFTKGAEGGFALPTNANSGSSSRGLDAQGPGPAVVGAEDGRHTVAATAAGGGCLLEALLTDAYRPPVVGRGELRHASEGWRCLESCVLCVLAVVRGAAHRFVAARCVTQRLLHTTCRHGPCSLHFALS